MAGIADIKSPVWTLSKNGGGAIAEGLSALRQCIDIIIRTTKNTDPLRPSFGSDVYKYSDYPVNVAIPNIKKAIKDALEIWEPRVKVTRIPHDVKKEQLLFYLYYSLADGTATDSILVTVGSGGVQTGVSPAQLILQGYFPPNPSTYQYFISLVLDGEEKLPEAPDSGFGSVYEMFDWVQANWLNYGRWYLTADGIIGYMNADYKTGSLTISLVQVKMFQGGIPPLPIGFKYALSITVDGLEITNDNTSLFTSSQILDFVQSDAYLGSLGTWKTSINPDSFSDDFNDDFSVYQEILQLFTNEADTVIIDIQTLPQ